MPKVNIVAAFTLTRDDGSTQKFNPGVYDLDDDTADHWYVVAHTDQAKHKPAAGTIEFAREEARKRARRKLLDAAMEEEVEKEVQAAEKDHRETVRRRIVAEASRPVQPPAE